MCRFVHLRKVVAVLLVAGVLAGCSTRTYVSATGSAPPQYTHVYITAQQVWLSTSALAQPGDGAWSKFTLSEPVTLDLISASNGTLTRLIGSLRLVPGSYAQIRLIPADTSAALTDSAKSIGAVYNNEVDYVDNTSVAHQLPLEMLAPESGIGAQGSLTVPVGGGALPVATSNSTSNGVSGGSRTLGLGANAPPTIVNFAVNFNAATDIALFTYDSQPGAVLNAHAQAFDLAKSGGISGTLTLTNLVNITNASARLNISATAESVSTDGSRHVVILSAPVHADGTFLLYPLPANNSTKNPTTYDVVIHGAGIQTMIIKGVQVPRNSSGSSSSTTASTALTAGTATVSVGTLIPQPASSYDVNLSAAATLPAGAILSLYQTLPGNGEVPYVIEQSTIDPFNNVLQMNLPVSSGLIQSGSYTPNSDQAITLTNATPAEGSGSYTVAASATSFTDGALSSTVSTPSSGTVSLATPAVLAVNGDAVNDSYTATILQGSAGSYDRGQLIVSRDGAIIATASLNTALATTNGTVTVSGLPGGSTSKSFAAGLYDVSLRVWNSTDPSGTLQHQYFPAAVDVRSGSVTGAQLTIN